LQCLLEATKLQAPRAPEWKPSEVLPDWFKLPQMLSRTAGGDGTVPFSDMAFDVPGDPAPSRYFAHRVVVASQSQVLAELVANSPLVDDGRVIVEVDASVSKEVWKCVLQFLYTTEIRCSFESNVDMLLELLQACALYSLPKPLVSFVESRLFALTKVEVAAKILVGSKAALRSAAVVNAATVVLSKAQDLISRDPDSVVPAALRAIDVCEQHVKQARVQEEAPAAARQQAPPQAPGRPRQQPARQVEDTAFKQDQARLAAIYHQQMAQQSRQQPRGASAGGYASRMMG